MTTTYIPEADLLDQQIPLMHSEEDQRLPDLHLGALEADPVDVWEQHLHVPDEEDDHHQGPETQPSPRMVL